MVARHFLTLRDLSPAELDRLLRRGIEQKSRKDPGPRPLSGRVLAMVFEKSSTRTRVSFETAMAQLGGTAIFLSAQDTQLCRGEPVEDMARVLSRMVDGIVVRTHGHDRLVRFAAHASVPVINGLSDRHHPCQLLADMQTYVEHRGPITGRRVAWLGDGNNVCCSYIEAAPLYGFTLHLCCPRGYLPPPEVVEGGSAALRGFERPEEAVRGAHLVVTDVWASMGQEQEAEARRAVFFPYQVNEALMGLCDPGALFMHCLPAHRGEEVSAGVMDGPSSVVWDEAGNRLHAQKALLELLLR
ncbi:MAG: ornithine carbamoyltransferase [Gammaproteobacteria bacterium]